MMNSVFRKTMGNTRNSWNIKFIATKSIRNLMSEPNYHTHAHTNNLDDLLPSIKIENRYSWIKQPN